MPSVMWMKVCTLLCFETLNCYALSFWQYGIQCKISDCWISFIYCLLFRLLSTSNICCHCLSPKMRVYYIFCFVVWVIEPWTFTLSCIFSFLFTFGTECIQAGLEVEMCLLQPHQVVGVQVYATIVGYVRFYHIETY